MLRFRVVILTVVLLILPTPSHAQHPPSQIGPTASTVLSLFPRVLDLVPSGVLAGRPLLIDVRSFVYVGSAIIPIELDAQAVQTAFGRAVVDATSEGAIIKQGETRFEIRNDGVFVRLDGLSRLGSTYSVLLTYLYTERRGDMSAIGATQVYATFIQRGVSWELIGERVLVTS